MSQPKLIFSRPTIKDEETGLQKTLISQPVDPPELALDWMDAFQNRSPVIFDQTSGSLKAVHGFFFEPSHVNDVIKNLQSGDQVYLGVAIRDGSHTLVLGGVRSITMPDDSEEHVMLYKDLFHPIYDYCDPCPPKCPTSIMNL